ncbi:MAG: hypothetical protein AAF555_11485 [Verrucomicrobiota bacterium]
MAQQPSAPAAPSVPGEEPHAAELFFQKHKLPLVGGVALVAILGVAALLLDSQKQQNQAEAGQALLAARDSAALQEIIADYPETLAAGNAFLETALLQWEEGDRGGAEATLRRFLTEFPQHPLRSKGHALLGSQLFQRGQPEEAHRQFEKLLEEDSGSYLVAYAKLMMAEIAETEEDARAALQAAIALNEFSPYRSLLQQAETFVGVELPTLVEAPVIEESSPEEASFNPPPLLENPLPEEPAAEIPASGPEEETPPSPPAPEPTP